MLVLHALVLILASSVAEAAEAPVTLKGLLLFTKTDGFTLQYEEPAGIPKQRRLKFKGKSAFAAFGLKDKTVAVTLENKTGDTATAVQPLPY
jgi:hypothetical protein